MRREEGTEVTELHHGGTVARSDTETRTESSARLEFESPVACGAALRAARSSGPPQAGGPQADSVIPSVFHRASVLKPRDLRHLPRLDAVTPLISTPLTSKSNIDNMTHRDVS